MGLDVIPSDFFPKLIFVALFDLYGQTGYKVYLANIVLNLLTF